MNFLKPNMRGWARAWNKLKEAFDGDIECLNDNEVWQYMGSTDERHEFRHRALYSIHGSRRAMYYVYVVDGDYEIE